jgi:hypothetical protein
MSGPIVRRYGFPNFDRIFGAKPLEHGVEETDQPGATGQGQESGRAEPKPEAPGRAEGAGTSPRKTS